MQSQIYSRAMTFSKNRLQLHPSKTTLSIHQSKKGLAKNAERKPCLAKTTTPSTQTFDHCVLRKSNSLPSSKLPPKLLLYRISSKDCAYTNPMPRTQTRVIPHHRGNPSRQRHANIPATTSPQSHPLSAAQIIIVAK